jgi:hypothetical protein
LALHFPESLDGTSLISWRKTLPFIRDNATLKSLISINWDMQWLTCCIDTVTMLEGNTTLECLTSRAAALVLPARISLLCHQPSTTLETSGFLF